MTQAIYAQVVSVFWTKASRGMPNAALRNSCAISYIVPERNLEALATGERYSSITLHEHDNFRPRQSIEAYRTMGKLDWGAVAVKHLNHDEALVRYQYASFLVGAPERGMRPPITCHIEQGQLVRVEHNGRFSEFGDGWNYVRKVYNFVSTDVPTPTMFLAKPTHYLKDLAVLF